MGVLLACVTLLCCTRVFSYEDKTITEFIQSTGGHVFLRNLLTQANMTHQLSDTGPYTFFAPSDIAFAKLGSALSQYSNRQLKSILEYHVHQNFLMVAMVTSPGNYSTVLGEDLLIEPDQGSLLLNSKAHVSTSNMDTILNNGVVHAIDAVLLPPAQFLTTVNIAEVLLQQDTRFKDLFLALLLANLTTTLEGENADFTVFAPTDSAFLKYRDNLLHPGAANAEQIYAEVLKYHVIPGGRRIKELQDGATLFTLQGTSVTIKKTGTSVTVNNANVIEGDIFASNGIIHAIDALLVPQSLQQQG